MTIKELIDAGVHYGHNKRYSNPKMHNYIHCIRNKMQIFDLTKTIKGFDTSLEDIERIAQAGGTILFVGTKRQAKQLVKEYAVACSMPFVNHRWLGGTLTNYSEIFQSVRKLQKMQNIVEKNNFGIMTNKEILAFHLTIDKLLKGVGGIAQMRKLPDMLIVIDVQIENIAVKEANTLGIPVVAIVDSNVTPEGVNYMIPANDDSQKGIKLYLEKFSHAIVQARTEKTEKTGIEK